MFSIFFSKSEIFVFTIWISLKIWLFCWFRADICWLNSFNWASNFITASILVWIKFSAFSKGELSSQFKLKSLREIWSKNHSISSKYWLFTDKIFFNSSSFSNSFTLLHKSFRFVLNLLSCNEWSCKAFNLYQTSFFFSWTFSFASSIQSRLNTFLRTINLSAGLISKILSASCKRKTILKNTSLGGKKSSKEVCKSVSFLNVTSSKVQSFPFPFSNFSTTFSHHCKISAFQDRFLISFSKFSQL